MAGTGHIYDEDPRFPLGANGYSDPVTLQPGSFIRGWNVTARGGLLRCRPGYKQLLELPDGKLQGMFAFAPPGGEPVLVFAVAGKVYFSYAPFDGYSEIPGILFDSLAERVYFAQAEQSVVRNSDLTLTFLESPRAILMMQDGLSAPAYWDGVAGGHITGVDRTPSGTCMVWCADRLWVARGSQVFVSDIFDPISFYEGQYIGADGIGSFILPSDAVALAKVPSVQQPIVLAFTEDSTTAFRAYIRNRDAWATTEGFQTEVLPDVGCVAPNSVVASMGQLWWFSKDGMTSLDLAEQAQVSSVRKLIDQNMELSKARLADDRSGVASAVFDGYLLASVPFESPYNTHTWVLDLEGGDSLQEDQPPAWQGWWTGTRPVQWATTTVFSRQRIFFVSTDADGTNRLWEAFQASQLDNDCPITWGFETRAYTGGTLADKGMRYAKIGLAELKGTVDVQCFWAGAYRGSYIPFLNKRIVATEGSVDAELELAEGEPTIFELRTQSRDVLSEDVGASDTPDTAESDDLQGVDNGFTLCFQCNGVGAVRSVRIFMQPRTDTPRGECEDGEEETRAVRFDGLSAKGDDLPDILSDLSAAPTEYFATVSVSGGYGGYNTAAAGNASSSISLATAQKQALAVARMRLDHDLSVNAPTFVGSQISA